MGPAVRAAAILAVVLGGLGRLPAAVAAEAPVRLTADQRARAAITLVEARAATGAASGGIGLTGRVAIPNDAVEVVLAGVAGRLESVAVHPGQRIEAGGVLGQLYSPQLLALQRAYLAAKLEASQATAREQRDVALLDAGVIAASRLETTRNAQAAARAALEEQRQLLRLAGETDGRVAALNSAGDMTARLAVRARRAAVVLEQAVDVGAAVEAGTPLFRLAVPGVLWIELQATAAQAARIAPGDIVAVRGCEQRGVVLASGAQLAAATQTVPLRAEVRDKERCLMPNQFVEVEVRSAAPPTNSVTVPAASLVQRAGTDYVFVASGEDFVPTPVRVVGRAGTEAHVEGIAPGTRVASGGTAVLKGAWSGLGPEPR